MKSPLCWACRKRDGEERRFTTAWARSSLSNIVCITVLTPPYPGPFRVQRSGGTSKVLERGLPMNMNTQMNEARPVFHNTLLRSRLLRNDGLSRAAGIALAIVFLGLCYIGFLVWREIEVENQSFNGRDDRLGGPKTLTAVHEWEDGQVIIQWDLFRTDQIGNRIPAGVSPSRAASVPHVYCSARAMVVNQGQEPLKVRSLSLILTTSSGVELHTVSEPSSVLSSLSSLIPSGEYREINFNFWVPVGVYKDVGALSARLGFSFGARSEE